MMRWPQRSSGVNTPRTRAALAREAAAKAAQEAQEAAVKAYAAAEVAAAAERDVLDVLPIESDPAPSTSTRRNLCLDLQVVDEVDETNIAPADPPLKKMTPKKKLATKVKKTPAKKYVKSPAKKGKK
nr:unnamed protein product [Digitaria exilis]